MFILAGLVMAVAAAAVFYFSLPRGGKTARFVGTEWEGYVVVAMIGVLGIGVIMTIVGATSMLKGA
jgi:hypothetical protein